MSARAVILKSKKWEEFNQNKSFLAFKKAREYVRKLNLKNQKEWQYYSATERPSFIPGSPSQIYQNDGWVNLSDWLGSENKSTSEKKFLSYEDAKKWAIKNNIKSGNDWLVRGSRFHNFLPSTPYRTYKDQWKGWADFLGKEKK